MCGSHTGKRLRKPGCMFTIRSDVSSFEVLCILLVILDKLLYFIAVLDANSAHPAMSHFLSMLAYQLAVPLALLVQSSSSQSYLRCVCMLCEIVCSGGSLMICVMHEAQLSQGNLDRTDSERMLVGSCLLIAHAAGMQFAVQWYTQWCNCKAYATWSQA